jgi:protein-export membrane protein SecD
LLRDWRVLLLLVLVITSLVLLIPAPSKGVTVRSVSTDSPLAGKLTPGATLEWMNERQINAPEDVYAFDSFTGTLRFISNGQLELADIQKPGLGIEVAANQGGRLSFGLDLIGGTRVLLEPTANVSSATIDQVIATLQTRINIYGLRESKFQPVTDLSGNRYIQIEMAGGSPQEVQDLLAKQGTFTAKIPRTLRFTNGGATLLNTSVRSSDSAIIIDGKTYAVNSTFRLAGMDWEVANVTADMAVVIPTVYTGADVKSVCLTEQPGVCTSRVQRTTGGWEFDFQITTSQDAADRFADATRGLQAIVDPKTGSSYLESRIVFYIDNKPVTDLSISSDLAGRALASPLINGFRTSRDDALKEKLKLQSILQSGALPVPLEIVRIDSISATLGSGFIYASALAGVLATAAVGALIFIRYRRWRVALPVMATSISEVIIILGVIALIGYTLDLAAIAGIIATVGTSVDSQVMLVDELLSGAQIYTLRQRIKRAFFMIFGSAATIIAAMLPLAIIGIGVMRGFAIVTMLGVFIGIGITRPAFARIAEKIIEKENERAPIKA